MQKILHLQDGGKLVYQVSGDGYPIVLVHAFSLDHRMWQPQVEFLSKTNQVITYDVRGFGKSSLPNVAYDHADDLKLLLDHLNISQAHIVGLSMGGRIGVNFTLAYPGKVKSLIVMDSSLDGYASEVDWNVFAREQGVEQAKKNWLNHRVFLPTSKSPKTVAWLKMLLNDYSGWHWLNLDPTDPGKTGKNAMNNLGQINTPTLVVVGEQDLPYFHNIANAINGGIRNSKKVIVPNVGHMVNLEAPNLINQLIADFINAKS